MCCRLEAWGLWLLTREALSCCPWAGTWPWSSGSWPPLGTSSLPDNPASCHSPRGQTTQRTGQCAPSEKSQIRVQNPEAGKSRVLMCWLFKIMSDGFVARFWLFVYKQRDFANHHVHTILYTDPFLFFCRQLMFPNAECLHKKFTFKALYISFETVQRRKN